MTKKISSIEAFRFFFMLIICIWHYNGPDGFLKHGYLCVDFFFILSGMLLYNTFCNKSVSIFDYTIRKIKKFFPEYFLCMLLLYAGKFFNNKPFSFNEIYQFISELLMLQAVGLWDNGMNWPTWYVSVLVYGGMLIYAILKYQKDLALKIIFPIIILLGYTHIFSKTNHIEVWGNATIISYPLLRGICDMTLGVIIMTIHKSKLLFLNTKQTILLDIISILSLILFIKQLIDIQDKDSYSLIFISVILVSLFRNKSIYNIIFKAPIWGKLGSITYEMLIVHVPCLGVLNIIIKHIHLEGPMQFSVYLTLVLIGASALKFFNNNILNKWLFPKQKRL